MDGLNVCPTVRQQANGMEHSAVVQRPDLLHPFAMKNGSKPGNNR